MANETKQQADFINMLTRCRGSVLRVCLFYTKLNGENFQDLYQDILCALWESWPSFKGKSKANTWATRIALNVGALKYRAHKRMPTFIHIDEEICNNIADETSVPYHDLLYQLIERLDSEEDRQLLYLYLDRKKQSEIAKILGISTEAVRQRIHRITEKLIKLNEQEKK